VYKLEEIDRRLKLLRRGAHVLDLGCAPGSWLQYAAAKVGPKGLVVGVDEKAVELSLPAHVTTLRGDVLALPAHELGALASQGYDVVLSDLAPKTSGVKFADAARSAQLVRQALALAQELLKPGGHLVAKLFHGEEIQELRQAFQASFRKVRLLKPKGSRKESVETFLAGLELEAEAS
jgi:23S rRNA (uridine2552-2'-O)-methyltransferase